LTSLFIELIDPETVTKVNECNGDFSTVRIRQIALNPPTIANERAVGNLTSKKAKGRDYNCAEVALKSTGPVSIQSEWKR
jgi:hypothetical protein